MKKNFNSVLGTLIIIAVVFGLLFGLAQLVSASLVKSEVVSCMKLESQSREFSKTFYLTDWQKDMCDSHGIVINAPVK